MNKNLLTISALGCTIGAEVPYYDRAAVVKLARKGYHNRNMSSASGIYGLTKKFRRRYRAGHMLRDFEKAWLSVKRLNPYFKMAMWNYILEDTAIVLRSWSAIAAYLDLYEVNHSLLAHCAISHLFNYEDLDAMSTLNRLASAARAWLRFGSRNSGAFAYFKFYGELYLGHALSGLGCNQLVINRYTNSLDLRLAFLNEADAGLDIWNTLAVNL